MVSTGLVVRGMPAVDITIGSDHYKSIDAPEGCTVGKWKGFIAEGCLGKKVLYAEKLVCRSKLGGAVLEDNAPLPVAPERLYLEGRPPIIKVLQLALKDKLKPDMKAQHLMHPRPQGDRDLPWKRNTLAAGKEGVETAAAKVFAQELDEATIRRIWKRFPTYRGDVPEAARFWSEGDLERFFASGGQLKPCEVAEPGGQTCTLLRRLRLELAEHGISKVTSEYKSLGRHMSTAGFEGLLEQAELPPDVPTLPSCAGWSDVERVAKAPKVLREPVVLQWLPSTPGQVSSWDMDFWKKNHGDWLWGCRARTPAFEGDVSEGPEAVVFSAGIAEYVDYARVLAEEDPAFEEEAAMAYFRVHLDGWPAFTQCMYPVFEKHWKELCPPGIEDLTVRWVRLYADKFGCDWLGFLARFFKVSLAAPGSITRLHRENFGAHAWIAQMEGRRLFFLFSPKETEKLYAAMGSWVDCREGYVAAASPVDIFSPNPKRHPGFSEAKARTLVLGPGETLIVPSGWWWYSVALEPSASMSQNFFNSSNHRFFTQALEDLMLQYGELAPASRADAQEVFAQLQEEIQEDTEDWALTVTEGGS